MNGTQLSLRTAGIEQVFRKVREPVQNNANVALQGGNPCKVCLWGDCVPRQVHVGKVSERKTDCTRIFIVVG